MKLAPRLSITVFAALTATAGLAADDNYVDSSTVRQVQKTLNDRGYPRVGVDGAMGPRTQAAIRQFQRAESLEPTGQLNRQTLVALGIQRADPAARTDEPQYSADVVRKVQQTLNQRGFKAGAVDGTMSPQTQAAVKEFQKSENLEDSGRLNPRTLTALGVSVEPPAVQAERRPATDGRAMSTSATARNVQRRLNELGYRAGAEDGVMGRESRAALTRFQQDKRLAATGRVDASTLAALGLTDSVATR
jgi:peptidoglycan hydrolase-like protein with peptidoglycan-binding domain